ncbi:MAG TPA: hypothetical protein VGD65_23065 [Chryseosolibacter sp.]
MKAGAVLLLVGMWLPAHSQVTRTIEGLVLSFGDKTPMAGITVALPHPAGEDRITDAQGRFRLGVSATDTVYLTLRGVHYEKYIRYYPYETEKTFLIYEPNPRKRQRENRRIMRDWRKIKN